MPVSEMLVVIIATISPFMLAIGVIVYLYKSRVAKQSTLIKIVELGATVDPEMMKMLSDDSNGHKTDFKYGLVWLAIGIPLTLGIWLRFSISDAVFGTIPVFIGIAYLIAAKYKLRETS